MKFFNIAKALNSERGEIRTIMVLIGMAVIGLGILLGSQLRDGRINLLPRASESDTVKIMTFNLLGEPLCRGTTESETQSKHKAEMASIMNYARTNNISILALQEVVKQKDEQNKRCKFDLPQYLRDNASGYNVTTSEYIHIEDDEDDFEKWWYRIFITHTQNASLVGGLTRHQIGSPHRGFEAQVVNTKLGPIRLIHVHNGHHQVMDQLVPFINGFKAQDNIPVVVLGDFNIVYDGENGEPDPFKRMKHLEENAGLYRACDPAKFSGGNCINTVNNSKFGGDISFGIDHILIDKRAKFIVKNAYVDRNTFKFSDHFPVIVELQGSSAGAGTTDLPVTNQSTTKAPTGSTPSQINIWDQIKPAPGNIYLWSNGGPTTGWESYVSNYVYMCNGKYCWVFNRNTLNFNNNGNPIALDTDPGYSSLKAAPNGTLPWSNGGPTAAWTWILEMNGQTVYETMLCNGNYCWRYLRYPTTTGSGWRENGSPIYLPTYNDVWKDSRVASLWSGNGITVAWTDPTKNQATLCNKNDCRSIDYKTWQWRFNGDKIQPFPPNSGVTEYKAAWTSPATYIISLCNGDTCWKYNIPAASWDGTERLIPGSNQLPVPSGLTHTCNTNGTVILRWNSVSGAGEYAARLDEQGTSSSSPVYNWYSPPTDTVGTTSLTSITMPITLGRYYQAAVTAVRTAGSAHPGPTWQPRFICNAAATPTRTPTPAANAKPVLNTFVWNPTTLVSGKSVTGTIVGTDSDSRSVNVELYVSGSGYSNVLFASGTAAVSSGKWTFSATKTVPVGPGSFVAYVVMKDGVNTVRSGNYNISVVAATPTRVPPTATRTPTRVPPTATRTPTRVPPTATRTPTPTPNIGAITLSSPINSVVLKPGDVTLRWAAVTNATSYEWILYRTGKFKSGTVTTTSAVVPALPPGNYSWQVIAKGATGSRTSSFAAFKIPFSKIKPLANSQITYGSTQSFEWTPMLAYDVNQLYFTIAETATPNNPFYFKQLTSTSPEYLAGKVTIPLSSATNAKFVLGKTYVWHLIISNAGTSQEHYPPFDATNVAQSFTLVSTPVATATPTRTPTPTVTKAPTIIASRTPTTDPCARVSQGDANCDGKVNLIDGVCWVQTASGKPSANCRTIDFNGNKRIGMDDLLDFGIWRTTFIKENTVGTNPPR